VCTAEPPHRKEEKVASQIAGFIKVAVMIGGELALALDHEGHADREEAS
jgi:hypothetical protein